MPPKESGAASGATNGSGKTRRGRRRPRRKTKAGKSEENQKPTSAEQPQKSRRSRHRPSRKSGSAAQQQSQPQAQQQENASARKVAKEVVDEVLQGFLTDQPPRNNTSPPSENTGMPPKQPEAFWTVGEQVDTQYGPGTLLEVRADGVAKVALSTWKMAQDATVHCFLQSDVLRKPAAELGATVATSYGSGQLLEKREDGSVVVRLQSWQLAGTSRPMLYLRDARLISLLAETQDTEGSGSGAGMLDEVPKDLPAPRLDGKDDESVKMTDQEGVTVEDVCEDGEVDVALEPRKAADVTAVDLAPRVPPSSAPLEVAASSPTAASAVEGGHWIEGEEVLTTYGVGSITGFRKDGIVSVALRSWRLAQNATVNCFLQKSAISKPSFAAGDIVYTTYGQGHITDTRADGSVVVRLDSWKLAGQSRPMLYLKDTSMVSRMPLNGAQAEASKQQQDGEAAETSASAASAAAAAAAAEGEAADAAQDAEQWAVGEEVLTIYGSGCIDEIRDDGAVRVTLNSWKLAKGAPVRCFLQTSALRRPVVSVGEEVETAYGRGTFVERRANRSVVVRLESWKLAGGSRPMLYLRDETMIAKAAPRKPEDLNPEERLARVQELREQGNEAFVKGDVDAAMDHFAECLGFLTSLQSSGAPEMGTSQKARTLSSWIPVCLMMARCVYKKEQYKTASAHAQNAYELCKVLCDNPTTAVYFRILRLLNPGNPTESSTVLGRWPMSALIVNARAKLKLGDYAGAEKACRQGLKLEQVEPKQKDELAKLYKKAKSKAREDKKREQVVAQRMFSSPENGKSAKSVGEKKPHDARNGSRVSENGHRPQQNGKLSTTFLGFWNWDPYRFGVMAAIGLGFSGLLLLRSLRRRQ